MASPKKPTRKPAAKSRMQRLADFAHREVKPAVSWISISTMAALVGIVYFAEDRFAHASDVRQLRADLTTGQEVNRLTTEVATMDLRLQLLRQNLYQVTYAQGPMTLGRRQEMERLATAIRDTGTELDAKRRLLDRVRTGR